MTRYLPRLDNSVPKLRLHEENVGRHFQFGDWFLIKNAHE